MLHINDLTYRIGERLLIDHASVAIPTGARVGLVGRNGAGKTTLFRIVRGELSPETGGIGTSRNARIGSVEQEAPGGAQTLIDFVLDADVERRRLLAEANTAHDPHRIAEIQTRLADIEAHAAPARAARILAGLGFDEAAQNRALSEFSGGWRMRVALAAVLFSAPDLLLLDEPTNYLDLEGAMWLVDYLEILPRHGAGDQPRPRPARRRRQPHPASRPRQAHLVERRLYLVRAPARGIHRPARQGGQEAGGKTQAPAKLRRPFPRQRHQGDAGAIAPQDARQNGAGGGDGGRFRAAVRLAAGGQETRLAAGGDGRRQRRL